MFPDFWPNIWTSSDVSTSNLVNMEQHEKAIGTANWPNFPVLCTHSYSWPLYSFINGIVGVGFGSINDIIIQPAMPKELGAFEFNSSLVDVVRDDDDNYLIKYKPKRFVGDIFKVILDLSVVEDDITNAKEWIFEKKISVNKQKTSIQLYFDHLTNIIKLL